MNNSRSISKDLDFSYIQSKDFRITDDIARKAKIITKSGNETRWHKNAVKFGKM
jgi:hypothetical protein